MFIVTSSDDTLRHVKVDQRQSGKGVTPHMHGVSSLPGLADKDTHVIPEDWGTSVQQVAGQLQVDRQVCQALNSLSASQAGVERSPACHKHHTAPPPNAAQMVSQASQGDAAHLVGVNNNLLACGQM